MTQLVGYVSVDKPYYVCKLKKAIYRLKQVSRAWFNCLVHWGFKYSALDSSMLLYAFRNDFIIFLLYLDDIVITESNSQLIQEMIDNLHKTFTLKDLRKLNFLRL